MERGRKKADGIGRVLFTDSKIQGQGRHWGAVFQVSGLAALGLGTAHVAHRVWTLAQTHAEGCLYYDLHLSWGIFASGVIMKGFRSFTRCLGRVYFGDKALSERTNS